VCLVHSFTVCLMWFKSGVSVRKQFGCWDRVPLDLGHLCRHLDRLIILLEQADFAHWYGGRRRLVFFTLPHTVLVSSCSTGWPRSFFSGRSPFFNLSATAGSSLSSQVFYDFSIGQWVLLLSVPSGWTFSVWWFIRWRAKGKEDVAGNSWRRCQIRSTGAANAI
jgi:hypothetical protein